MLRFSIRWILPLLFLAGVAHGQIPGTDNDFLPVEEAFQYDVTTGPDNTIAIDWEITEGYYLYRSRLTVSGNNGTVERVESPAGQTITDEYFGESEVYYDSVRVTVAPGDAETLSLSWQGCAEAGLCYPPQTATVAVPGADSASTTDSGGATTGASGSGTASQNETPDTALAEDQSLAQQLSDDSLFWSLAVFFVLGILLVFTPCVLPMMPILSAVVVGKGAGRSRAFMLSLVFVLFMAVTYAVFGVIAAMAGANLQAFLQNPVFIGALAVLFVLLALAMFGLYELQLPAFLRDRMDSLNQKQSGGSLGSAAIMGVLSALMASPCMTAPLAGALLYIADTGDALLGGTALLALGLGMGAPLILLGTVGGQLMPRPGVWMNRVKAFFGFVLLGTAIYFLDRVLDPALTLGLWAALMLALAATLYSQLAGQLSGPLTAITRVLALLIGLWGGLMLIGAAGGAENATQPLSFLSGSAGTASSDEASEEALEFDNIADHEALQQSVASAARNGRWTLVEFYADWCISCQVIEEEVFGDSQVQNALADFQLIQADVTDNTPAHQNMMKQLDVVGPPTLMLYGPDGQEVRAQRVVGEIGPDAFLDRLEKAGVTDVRGGTGS